MNKINSSKNQAQTKISSSNLRAKEVKNILDKTRNNVLERLKLLDNSYHNFAHGIYVEAMTKEILENLKDKNSFNQTEKLLIIESALRHDDGHSGVLFRQEVANDLMSNEEYSAFLVRYDLGGYISLDEYKFIEENILGTSFGQSIKSKLPKGKEEEYFREYKAETNAQKIIAFADVSIFIKGWEKWIRESLRLVLESPENNPKNINDFIEHRKLFLNFYVKQKLEYIKELLSDEYYKNLEKELNKVIDKLNNISENEAKYYEKLVLRFKKD